MNRMTIAVAGVLMTCVGTSDIQAESYTVCSSGCDYTTIQGAISAASDGDTIQIQAGTYCENNLRIEGKSLTIEGVGTVDGCPAVTIDGEAEHRVFLIQGSSATDTCLDNLYICNGHTITDSKGSEWNGGGIWVGDCSRLFPIARLWNVLRMPTEAESTLSTAAPRSPAALSSAACPRPMLGAGSTLIHAT